MRKLPAGPWHETRATAPARCRSGSGTGSGRARWFLPPPEGGLSREGALPGLFDDNAPARETAPPKARSTLPDLPGPRKWVARTDREPGTGPGAPHSSGMMFRDHDACHDHEDMCPLWRLSGDSGSWKVKRRRLCGRDSFVGPGDSPLRGVSPALARRVVAARSLSRLWRGELSLRGALSAHRTANTPCCEKSPRQRRRTLRDHGATDGERSAIMLRRGNAPRSRGRTRLTAITGEAISYRRNRARLAPQDRAVSPCRSRALRARSKRAMVGRQPA